MQDISEFLKFQMTKKHCTPLYAFLIATEDEKKDVYILQSKSIEEVGGRLRDKSNFKNNR